jgi:hypothetical protein
MRLKMGKSVVAEAGTRPRAEPTASGRQIEQEGAMVTTSAAIRTRILGILLVPAAVMAETAAAGSSSPETLQWFQKTEQALMDAMAPGDKSVWDRIMDPSFVLTSEEGEVLPREQFLDVLRPLPEGLSGAIVVKDLTVQEYDGFAVVRYLADETETIFGQKIAVQYRVTNVYRREAPAWKMLASHLSVVTRDPPVQEVSKAGWPGFVGQYRLLPAGWTFSVELRDGELYGGRDPKKLRRLIPLAPDAFVLTGALGEWVFVVENGKPARIVNLRKFAVLVWTRVEAAR